MATLSFIKLVKKDQKIWSGIWRFAVAPSDAAQKNRNIGAQLQSIPFIKAPKTFWKIYFQYDFRCAQTYTCTKFDNLCLRYIATCEKKIYRCTSTFPALSYRSGSFFKSLSYLSATKSCAQTFLPIFGLFKIFDRNFAKIVVPPSNKNKNYLVPSKGQSTLRKTV